MTQGISTLLGTQQAAQQPQAPQAPGQAAPFQALPTPQGKTPGIAQTPALSQQSTDALLAMYRNPKLLEGTPYSLYGVIGALSQQLKAEAAAEAAKNNAAMTAYGQQVQQPPVAEGLAQQVAMRARPPQMARHGGIMHGYAGGGPVAFEGGGITLGYDRDYNDARRFGISLSPYDAPAVHAEKLERVQRMREFEAQQQTGGRAEIPNEFAIANTMAGYRDPRRARLDVPYTPPTAAPVPAPRPPRANRPGTGVATAAPTTAPATPTAPPVDRYGEIEAEGIAGIKALQDLLRKQGETDPELARLRQAAYESAQGIASRRERERAAALEAAQKATTSPLLQNQEALLRMAASLGGAKRFGEGLSRAAGAAGEVRGEQRKALEAAQKVSREEQNAIDQLNQALAEKRVADRSGDVNKQQEAAVKVAEAQLKITDLRKGLQVQRGVEADREEQRKIAREQMANQLRVAQVGAAARESTAGLAEQRLAIQAMRADPSYAGIVKELTDAKKLAGVSNSPTFQARLRAAEAAAKQLAAAYGVTPAAMGMAFGATAPAAAAAPASGAENDPLGIRKS